MIRTADNTQRGKFHTMELMSGGYASPLMYNGATFPISLLNTYNLLVNKTQVLIKDTDGTYYNVLHANSELTVTNDSQVVGKVKKGTPAVVGDNLNKKQSPAPFCYVDDTGAINSSVSSDAIWSESVMGYTAEGKSNTYSQGFVRDGSAVHGSLFLRKDGNWATMSPYTGSVSEHFLSLNDTPITYQDQIGKYLRVSYAEGGSVVFDSIDTSKVPESSNLYYTEARVESKITQKTGDRSLDSLSVVNTVTAKDFLCDSDRRLKERITDMKPRESLRAVLMLAPKRYMFKGTHKVRFGLISQEVKEILPDLVNAEGPFEKINYMDLIPHLVGCIQGLYSDVQKLRLQVKQLSQLKT